MIERSPAASSGYTIGGEAGDNSPEFEPRRIRIRVPSSVIGVNFPDFAVKPLSDFVVRIPIDIFMIERKTWLELLRKRIRNMSSRCRQILASQIGQAGQRVARLPGDNKRSE